MMGFARAQPILRVWYGPTSQNDRISCRPPGSRQSEPSVGGPRSEQALGVAAGDAFGLVGGKLRQPGAVGLEDAVVAKPALVDPGVGADQKAVGMECEKIAPLRGELARAVGDAAAVGQLAPQPVA